MLVLFIGSTGSGKNAIIKSLVERYENGDNLKFKYIVSSTSRSPRDYESEGNPYKFLTEEHFVSKLDSFIEYEEIHGKYYGVDMDTILEVQSDDNDTIYLKDIGVLGAVKVQELLGSEVITIWVETPSLSVTLERLIGRGESSESIKTRLERIEFERTFKDKFDYRLINDDLNTCVNEVADILGLNDKKELNFFEKMLGHI